MKSVKGLINIINLYIILSYKKLKKKKKKKSTQNFEEKKTPEKVELYNYPMKKIEIYHH